MVKAPLLRLLLLLMLMLPLVVSSPLHRRLVPMSPCRCSGSFDLQKKRQRLNDDDNAEVKCEWRWQILLQPHMHNSVPMLWSFCG